MSWALADFDCATTIPLDSRYNRPGVAERAPEAFPVIEIVNQPIDAERLLERVVSPEAGAVVLFLGITREFTGARQTVSEILRSLAVRDPSHASGLDGETVSYGYVSSDVNTLLREATRSSNDIVEFNPD